MHIIPLVPITLFQKNAQPDILNETGVHYSTLYDVIRFKLSSADILHELISRSTGSGLYNYIAFVNSEHWLAKSCVDITQCQNRKFLSLYFFLYISLFFLIL